MSGHQRKARDERIRAVFAQCGTVRETARRLGHSVNTVRKVLRGQSRDRQPPRTQPRRPSKLDAFRPVIRRLVLDDALTAVLVLEELRQLGYTGGYSILKDCVRQLRPAPANRRPTTVLEHEPGAQGQVDWSPYRVWLGGVDHVVHAFSLVLPFSRYMVVRFALDETIETLVALHEEAFADIGAVPALMTYDNMTTVGRHTAPGQVWINPRFAAFAEQYGFAIELIDPGRPNQHASVERPFHYIEHNCLRRRRRRFTDLCDLNAHAAWWCREVANTRIHGTTRQRPVDRLDRERLYLGPLPSERALLYRELERKVGRDFCVRVASSSYSVHPRHVGADAVVRVYTDRIEILIDGRTEAVHPLAVEPHGRHVLPEHEDAFKRRTPSRLLLEQAFLRLGPTAERYYAGLKVQRGRGAGYHLQRILKLADRYGADAVCGAMAHAGRYGNYGAEAVSRILYGRPMPRSASGQDPAPPPPERVRQWLLGLDVERRDLEDFDVLVQGRQTTTAQDPAPRDPTPQDPAPRDPEDDDDAC
jgi:transposase